MVCHSTAASAGFFALRARVGMWVGTCHAHSAGMCVLGGVWC